VRRIFCKTWVRALFQALLATTFSSIMITQAWADVRIGEYQCGAERQWVKHCAEMCAIAYPDRPKPRGFTIEKAEATQAVEARLRSCRYLGGFGYEDATPAVQHTPAVARATAQPGRPVKFKGPVKSTSVCTINDYQCHWRHDHPYAPANEAPYAPPPAPGSSQLNPWNKAPGSSADNPWNQPHG
jgi:hypothetical protein